MLAKIGQRLRRRPSAGAVIGTVALAAALGGGAYAAIPGSDGQIKGCYAATDALVLGIPYGKGDLRAIDSAESCRSYEKQISWNQQGPKGDTGATGPQGPKGDTGPQGPKGDPGSGPIAFGRIDGNASVDTANSNGLTAANVRKTYPYQTSGNTSFYCVNGLGNAKVLIATPENDARVEVSRSNITVPVFGSLCPTAGFNFLLVLRDSRPNPVPYTIAFDVVIY